MGRASVGARTVAGIELSWERCEGRATGCPVSAFPRQTRGVNDQGNPGPADVETLPVGDFLKTYVIELRQVRVESAAYRRFRHGAPTLMHTHPDLREPLCLGCLRQEYELVAIPVRKPLAHAPGVAASRQGGGSKAKLRPRCAWVSVSCRISCPARIPAEAGRKGAGPAAIRLALTRLSQSASLGRYVRANVVFPVIARCVRFPSLRSGVGSLHSAATDRHRHRP